MFQASDPLAKAFVRQSAAAAKNRVRAQKAEQDKRPDAAKTFRALAEAQEIHAHKILMLLRGRIGTTEENLAEAAQELRENALRSLEWVVCAEAQNDRAAASLILQIARTTESHTKIAPGQNLRICSICGYITQDENPERCPVCNAVPEKFRAVE